MRGLAVLAVMVNHFIYNVPRLEEGFIGRWLFQESWAARMGVDAFFVLSGFLITGILLDSKTTPRFFVNYYARRVLRIWPLYYLLVFFALLVVPHVRPDLGTVAGGHPFLAYVFFLQNFLVSPTAYALLGVTWSLAIEEQFYLVWPVVVRCCTATILTRILIVTMVAEPVLRFAAIHAGMSDYPSIYLNVFCRLDGLAAGGLLAIYVRSPRFSVATLRQFWRWAIPIAALGFAAAYRSLPLRYSFPALGFTGFVAAATYSRSIWLSKLLQWPPLLYTGKISYGLYLLHAVVLPLCSKVFFRHFRSSTISGIIFFFTAIILSYLAATASWYLLERNVLRLKSRFTGPPLAPAQFSET